MGLLKVFDKFKVPSVENHQHLGHILLQFLKSLGGLIHITVKSQGQPHDIDRKFSNVNLYLEEKLTFKICP